MRKILVLILPIFISCNNEDYITYASNNGKETVPTTHYFDTLVVKIDGVIRDTLVYNTDTCFSFCDDVIWQNHQWMYYDYKYIDGKWEASLVPVTATIEDQSLPFTKRKK